MCSRITRSLNLKFQLIGSSASGDERPPCCFSSCRRRLPPTPSAARSVLVMAFSRSKELADVWEVGVHEGFLPPPSSALLTLALALLDTDCTHPISPSSPLSRRYFSIQPHLRPVPLPGRCGTPPLLSCFSPPTSRCCYTSRYAVVETGVGTPAGECKSPSLPGGFPTRLIAA